MSLEIIVAIGASAGGIAELRRIFRAFPQSTSTAFFVAVHVSPSGSILPQILGALGDLPAEHPQDGRLIEPGLIYVAPPDYHLLIEDGVIRLNHGAKENRLRPAIDPLFRSAAHAYGQKVVGVVLSGMLDDGVSGLSEIQAHGGLVVIQDPEEAAFPGMPRNVLAAMDVDLCAPVEDIRSFLVELSTAGSSQSAKTLLHSNKAMNMTARQKRKELKEVDGNKSMSAAAMLDSAGPPSGFVCPECNGPLWETSNGNALHFRCLVGHNYSSHHLAQAYGEGLESSLWTALRILEERIELQKRLSHQAGLGKQHVPEHAFLERAGENQKHAEQIKSILEQLKT